MNTQDPRISDLNEALAKNMERLAKGAVTPAVANSIANSAATMLRGAKMELDYAKANGRKPRIALLEKETE